MKTVAKHSIALLVLILSSLSIQGQTFSERGIAAFNQGDLKQAERWFYWAIEADSSDVMNWINRAEVRRNRNNHQGAKEDLEQALKLDSTSGDVHFLLGISAFHSGEMNKSIKASSNAIKLGNSYGAQAYMNRAQAFVRAGKNKKALEDYASAIALKDERQQQAYFDRGQLYMRLNDKKSALEDFKQVVIMNPSNIQLTWDVGALAYELELYTDALSYYSKAIERIDKPQAQMLLLRGEVFEKLKNYEAAIQDYSRVIEMKQNLADAHYLRGQATARLGKTEDACVDWKKAAELGHTEAKGVIVYNCK